MHAHGTAHATAPVATHPEHRQFPQLHSSRVGSHVPGARNTMSPCCVQRRCGFAHRWTSCCLAGGLPMCHLHPCYPVVLSLLLGCSARRLLELCCPIQSLLLSELILCWRGHEWSQMLHQPDLSRDIKPMSSLESEQHLTASTKDRSSATGCIGSDAATSSSAQARGLRVPSCP
jgi:hypothetical protein